MHNLKQKTCWFTGHRIIPSEHLSAVTAGTERRIRELIAKNDIQSFAVGGAIGYDTLAANILFHLRKTDFPQIQIILIYPFEGFQNCWSDEQKNAYSQMFPQYDKQICAAPAASKSAYLVRDRYLVDCSNVCIAYCTRRSGGTAYTVCCAQKNRLTIYNVYQELAAEKSAVFL